MGDCARGYEAVLHYHDIVLGEIVLGEIVLGEIVLGEIVPGEMRPGCDKDVLSAS